MKKKILVVNDLVTGGGVENVLYNLLMFLYERGYDITVMTFYGDKKEFNEVFPDDIRYISGATFVKNYKRKSLKWFIHKIFRVLYKFILSKVF